jgi:iturin family lipopeptide synthetase A
VSDSARAQRTHDAQARPAPASAPGLAPIAILGVGLRLPEGIGDVEGLWSALSTGVDAVKDYPDAPWSDLARRAGLFGGGTPTPTSGAFLEQTTAFDPTFFGISPREASSIDPQHRLLLETGWEALENANIPADALAGSDTGVFVGIGASDYGDLVAGPTRATLSDSYSLTGANRAMAAGRLAYLLRSHGPAVSVDTTCSSSLVAVHLAVQSLRSHECELALASGAHLTRTPWSIRSRQLSGALSPTGRCRAFDAAADGFVIGEGVITIVLKRLADARRDGDPVVGVIHGSAMNQDGPSSGQTAPNGAAQRAVIRRALQNAGLEAAEVGYVEAHGTGTKLGDPIEAEALAAVYGRAPQREHPVHIGSVKTNFGHLEAAAGILSLVKALLVVQRGEIPPTLHQHGANPHIDWDGSNLAVQKSMGAWRGRVGRRIAGVSAFGLSGTNCHVLVSNANPVGPNEHRGTDPCALLAVSAKDEQSLRELAGRYVTALRSRPDDVADICTSARSGRPQFRHRIAVTSGDPDRIVEHLDQFSRTGSADSELCAGVVSARRGARPVMMTFPDGLSSIDDLPSDLYRDVPAFAAGVDEVRRAAGLLGVDADAAHAVALSRFTTRYALGRMWMRWGLEPQVCVLGETSLPVVAALTGLSPILDSLAWALGTGDRPPSVRATLDAELVVLEASNDDEAVLAGAVEHGAGQCFVVQIGGRRSNLPADSAVLHYGESQCQPAFVLGELCRAFVEGFRISWDGVGCGHRTARLPHHPYQSSEQIIPLPQDEAVSSDTATVYIREDATMNEVIDFLRQQFVELLGLEGRDIALDQPMFELGADSMMFAGLIERISRQYGTRIEVRRLFEELHTLADVAEAVAADLGTTSASTEDSETPPNSAPTSPAPKVSPCSPQPAAPAVTTETSPPAREARTHGGTRQQCPQPTPVSSRSGHLDPSSYFDDVIARYQRRTVASRDYAQANQSRLANNRRFVAPANRWAEQLRYPLCGVRSTGSRLWDADGSELIDLSMGFGSHLLGHSPEPVIAALSDQLRAGIQLGSANEQAGEVAELVFHLTGMERAFFCVSGTEAMMTAIRLARAATGRAKVVMFTQAYHGHFDGTLATPATSHADGAAMPMASGVLPSQVEDTLVLPLDRQRSLDVIEAHAKKIAAVVVEPVQNANPGAHPVSFLKQLRDLTSRLDIALVFDEVLTGFRVAPGGCQELFDIRADIVAYGKCLAAGLPMAAVTGRREYIDLVDGGSWLGGPRVSPDRSLTYTAGTYANHPLALSAASAVLRHLKDRGPRLQSDLSERADTMTSRINRTFEDLDVPMRAAGFGSFFRLADRSNLSFVHQAVEADVFRANLSLRGVYVAETGASFISTAHSVTDIDLVVAAVEEVATEMKEAGCWGGPGRTARDDGARSPRQGARAAATATTAEMRSAHRADLPTLSVSFFGDSEQMEQSEHLRLVIEGAELADDAGLEAVWIPERHFHGFGGFSPNPAVLASTLAQRTERIQLRAGSVAAPLHHPARIAEEWGLVDALSGGRVGLSFASGWNDRDFILSPGSFDDRHEIVKQHLETVRSLWRGDEAVFSNGTTDFAVRTFPRPHRNELPVWMTTLSNPDTFASAGKVGAGVLTNLLRQDLDQLAANIEIYRQARERAGLDPVAGHVTVLLHTLLGADAETAKDVSRGPLTRYLRSAMNLTGAMSPQARRADVTSMEDQDREYLVRRAADALLGTKSLIGSAETVMPLVRELGAAGVDEIACFVDFGAPTQTIRRGFSEIGLLNERLHRERRDARSTRTSQRPSRQPAPAAAEVSPEPGGDAEVRDMPVTANQRLVWATSQLSDLASTAYNLRRVLRLVGPLDVPALRSALQELVSRHASLRAGYSDDGLRVRVAPAAQIALSQYDLTRSADPQAEVDRVLWAESQQPFDLAEGPLARACLVTQCSDTHLLCLTTHHVAVDGTAENVLLRELGLLYSTFHEHSAESPNLPEPAALETYLSDTSTRPVDSIHSTYWTSQLADLPGLFRSPEFPSDELADHRGGRRYYDFSTETLTAVRQYASKARSTPFMVVLAAFMAFLGRTTGQDDVVVGVPVARRGSNAADAELVAYCANTLPIRLRAALDDDFAVVLGEVRSTLLDGFEHEEFSYAEILNLLPRLGPWGRPPVAKAVFGWDDVVTPRMDGLRIEHQESEASAVRFDLGLNVTHADGRHRLAWDYNRSLFEKHDVDRMHTEFLAFLDAVVEEGASRAAGDESPESSQNQPATDSRDTSAVEILEAQLAARRSVDCVGSDVEGGGGPGGMSGDMVVGRASVLAARLVWRGVTAGDVVAVDVRPGPSLLVALLGVLRVGAAVSLEAPSVPGIAMVSDRLGEHGEGANPLVQLDEWDAHAGPPPSPPQAVTVALHRLDGATLTDRDLVERVGRRVDELSTDRDQPVLVRSCMDGFDEWVSLVAAATLGRCVRWQFDTEPATNLGASDGEPARMNGTTSPNHRNSTPTNGDHGGDTDNLEVMVGIWRDVLRDDTLNADSDFFDAGGDSMQAIQILARVRRTFDRRVSANALFAARTAGAFSRSVHAQPTTTALSTPEA